MKVMSVAGAYWRETEKTTINSCLWNIIPKTKRFNRIFELLEEAKRRIRKLGKN
jgi:threonyl-tRNA synthetase